jgi:hypothetical protein
MTLQFLLQTYDMVLLRPSWLLCSLDPPIWCPEYCSVEWCNVIPGGKWLIPGRPHACSIFIMSPSPRNVFLYTKQQSDLGLDIRVLPLALFIRFFNPASNFSSWLPIFCVWLNWSLPFLLCVVSSLPCCISCCNEVQIHRSPLLNLKFSHTHSVKHVSDSPIFQYSSIQLKRNLPNLSSSLIHQKTLHILVLYLNPLMSTSTIIPITGRRSP